nr:hypothetical protein [Tanacetum cinerariifolium]
MPDFDSFNDIHPYFDDNPLSGSTTYSSNSLLEEFTDELALITYPSDYDDNLKCDIEYDLREIEYLLYQGEDSDIKDPIDQTLSCFQSQSDFHKPDKDFSCSKCKEYSSLGCSSIPFLSPLIHSSMGKLGPALRP